MELILFRNRQNRIILYKNIIFCTKTLCIFKVSPPSAAIFLLYLLRPLARIMKGSFEKCFRSIICCHRCVDHPKEEEAISCNHLLDLRPSQNSRSKTQKIIRAPRNNENHGEQRGDITSTIEPWNHPKAETHGSA